MTKRIKGIGVLILSCLILNSCAKKETFNNTDTKVGNSNVVFFPTIESNGEHVVVISQGDTYTDEGATAILNGVPVEYTTDGTFDSNTPGVYLLTYQAQNEQGFSASDFRSIVVQSNDVAANDFSGTYVRTSNGQASTWTKTDVGVYTVSNPGGAAGASFTVIAVNYTGNTVVIPQQPSAAGTFASTEAEYDVTAGQYAWQVINGGYGPAVRTFVKQ